MFFATANLANPTELLDYAIRLPQEWLIGPRFAGMDFDARRNYVLCQIEWFLRANGIRPDDLRRDDDTYESACERIGLPRPEGIQISPQLIIEVI